MNSVPFRSLLLSVLPSLAIAASPNFYADLGVGISSGPNSVIAPNSSFIGNGGALSADITDVYGFNTTGVAGAYATLGYNLKPFVGLEVDYHYWGQQALSNYTGQLTTATAGISGNLESHSVGGNIVGYFPLDNSNINLYAKAGLAGLMSTLEVNDPQARIFFNPGSYSQSSTKAALTYGAGLEYAVTDYIAAQIAWSGISQLSNDPISSLHYDMASVGIHYTFLNTSKIYSK